jgi:hypothetical protein
LPSLGKPGFKGKTFQGNAEGLAPSTSFKKNKFNQSSGARELRNKQYNLIYLTIFRRGNELPEKTET